MDRGNLLALAVLHNAPGAFSLGQRAKKKKKTPKREVADDEQTTKEPTSLRTSQA
jgi:hypothetical protein